MRIWNGSSYLLAVCERLSVPVCLYLHLLWEHRLSALFNIIPIYIVEKHI